MSDRSDEQPRSFADKLLDVLHERYHVVSLVVVMLFMLWVRVQEYDRFIVDGQVFFRGNDPYYQFRETFYIVQNWPRTMPFDPWTNFPEGTTAGQFGTLFDQLVATAALIVGLGSPSQETVELVLLFSPAVFAALIAIPTYLVCRRLGGRIAGVVGVVILALLPGTFLMRTTVGFPNRHVTEVLFQVGAILAMMVALSAAERELPVWEVILDRDWDALRAPLGWSVLAGFALALYLWTWPPGIMLIGIFGLFFAIKMPTDYLHGRTPEPVAFVGAVSMTVVGLLFLSSFQTASFSVSRFSLLQPLAAFGVAAGCVFLAWLARAWEARDLDPELYPVGVGGTMAVGLGLFAVLIPGLFSSIVGNFQEYIGFGAGAEVRTIAEAQPFLASVDPQQGITATDVIMQEYGLMLFTAFIVLFYVLARPLFASDKRFDQAILAGGLVTIGAVLQFGIGEAIVGLGVLPGGVEPINVETVLVGAVLVLAMLRADVDTELLLVVVWALVIVAAAFTQVRFNYYLAAVVAVVNGYGARLLFDAIELTDIDWRRSVDVEPYQVMALLLAALLVVPVLVAPMAVGDAVGAEPGVEGQQQQTTSNVIEAANQTNPGNIEHWMGTFEWMDENTPEQGTYGGADGSMEYYGTYQPTDDFEYPEGAYGVMSWWDYGHWITVHGEQIPTANPFQQGATHAANYLLAPDEQRANEILDEDGDDHEEVRYVMVDWQMVHVQSKFSAPTVWYDDGDVDFEEDFVTMLWEETEVGYQPAVQVKEQRYYESTMNRLYLFDGSYTPAGGPHAPHTGVTVINYETQVTQDQEIKVLDREEPTITFETAEEAEAYIEDELDGEGQIVGIGPTPPEDVEALEQYRLVKTSEESQFDQQMYGEMPWVKTFEKVDGATVEGEGPPETTVYATVEMEDPAANETFPYTQRAETDENGEFTMTLPYSTTDYEEWGTDEGYTEPEVRAIGSYEFYTGAELDEDEDEFYAYIDESEVTEGQVVGEDDTPVSVDVSERTTLDGDQVYEYDPGNELEPDELDRIGGDEADDGDTNETNDGADETNDGADETNETGSIAPFADGSTVDDGASGDAAGDAVTDSAHAPGPDEAPSSPDAHAPATAPLRAGLLALIGAALVLEVKEP